MSISVVAEAVPGVAATAAPTLSPTANMLSRPIREAVPIGFPFARGLFDGERGRGGPPRRRGKFAHFGRRLPAAPIRPDRRDLSEQRRDVEDEVGED
jgi:hypothetical protein